MNEADVEELEFVRLRVPRLIPSELVEAVKFKAFTPERFYAYQEQNLWDPNNFLIALIDKSKKIKGYLWAIIDEVDGALFVNTFSICKEYWGKGKAMSKAIEIAKDIREKTQAPTVFWFTTNDRFFVKHGFKRSKTVLMEYVFEVQKESDEPQAVQA